MRLFSSVVASVCLATGLTLPAVAQTEEIPAPPEPVEATAPADEPADAVPPLAADTEPAPLGEVKLKFNFRYAPWKDVIEWFAEQADLSLVAPESVPQGTFNYTDSRQYTPAEAIDLLNSVLLTKGYTLVRRERMLMVHNLEDPLPPNLVTRIPAEQLDDRGEFELVGVLFDLNKLAPEDAEKEIEKLIGPQGSVVVLPKSRQLYVIETAGKLRTIRNIINRVENPEMTNQLEVMPIQHVTPDEVLVIARQLLGLPEGANAADDGSIRIAVDPVNNRFLVRGKTESIKQFQEVLELVDVAGTLEGGPGLVETPQLEVYPVPQADSEAALQVLQTLLAGQPDVRLAKDPVTGHLVVLARPSQHRTVVATLAQMQQDARQIEVIALQRVDPATAVLAIQRLFGGGGEEPDPKAPIVDADPTTASLLIRGTKTQIEAIRGLLAKMGEDPDAAAYAGPVADRGNLRQIPISGAAADKLLDQVEALWPTVRENKIRIVRPSASIRKVRPGNERPSPPTRPGLNIPSFDEFLPRDLLPRDEPEEATPEARQSLEKSDKTARRAVDPHTRSHVFRFVGMREAASSFVQTEADPLEQSAPSLPSAEAPRESKPGAEVVITLTPNGILLASEDLEALDELESLLLTLSESTADGRDYTVFYLKFAKAEVAASLLDKILGGGTAAGGGDAGGGSLLGDIAGMALGGGGGNSIVDSLLGLGGGGGGAVATTGAVSIVPDTRLNALVVQAGPEDVELVEQLLQIIDQESSPEDVQTVAKPRLIPIYYTSASEIANVVRQVYAGRIEGASGGGGQRQPSPEEFIRALRGGRGRGGNDDVKAEPLKMSLGVDERSNSLIVSAPEPLFQEVQELVDSLDKAGSESTETMRVVRLSNANPEVISQALTTLMDNVEASTAASSDNQNSNSNNRNGNQNDDIRRRIEFFRNLQRGLQQGGGQPGASGGGRPGGAVRPGGGRGAFGRGTAGRGR